MPSESDDKKGPVREGHEEEGDAADDKSLSSILSARKKKSSTNTASKGALSPKACRPKVTEVKKVEPREDDDSDDDDDSDAPIVRKGKGSSESRAKSTAAAKVKIEENVADDQKRISKRNSATKPDKDSSKKKEKEEEQNKMGSTASEQNGKKKEKKIYDLPGQKRDPPEERDPLRIFYETLYKQVPHSDMAQIWMMESGLLSIEEAKKVCLKKQNKNQQKISSPSKATTPSKRTLSEIVRKSTPTSAKKKTAEPQIALKQSKKRKIRDVSSDDDLLASVSKKKQRAP